MKVALALLLLTSPAFAFSEADRDACVAQADQMRQSGQWGPVSRAERVRDCNNALYRDVFSDEYWAYYVYVASEFQAGRMTEPQARALIAQKEAEVTVKRNASRPVVILPAPAPVYRDFRRPAPTVTSCSPDPWGNVTCTTTQ